MWGFPRGQEAKAHPGALCGRLELCQLGLCDSVLVWNEMKQCPRPEQRETRGNLFDERPQASANLAEVSDGILSVTQCEALPPDSSVVSNHARQKVVLMHLDVQDLATKKFHRAA